MLEPRFCDACHRSIARNESAVEIAGRVVCPDCGPRRSRGTGTTRASARRKRGRWAGRIIGVLVLVVLGFGAHSAVHHVLTTRFDPSRARSEAALPAAVDPRVDAGGSPRPRPESPPPRPRVPADEPRPAGGAADSYGTALAQDATPGPPAAAPPASVANAREHDVTPAGEDPSEDPANVDSFPAPDDEAAPEPEPEPTTQHGAEPAETDATGDAPTAPTAPTAKTPVANRFVGRYAARPARRRGPPDTRRAVDAGLDWLVRHQYPHGNWSCARFDERCTVDACTGAGDSSHDVGVTGLALLAFLGAGHSADFGEHAGVVRRGLEYLASMQDRKTGCIGRVGSHQAFLYDHAIAAQALAEGYGLSHWMELKEVAQRAIDFVLAARNQGAAWRYAYPPDGTNDTSVTGWMVAALIAGRDFGLDVDPRAFDGAKGFIEEMTHATTFRTGYLSRGGWSAREPGTNDRWPETQTEAMTAVGMEIRLLLGERPGSQTLTGGTSLLLACPPRGKPERGSVDYYYWYHGTLVMHQIGGRGWDEWERSLRTVLLAAQRRTGDARGSWDPEADPWGHRGGRVYSTAIVTLCFETYDRFDRGHSVPPLAAPGVIDGGAVPAAGDASDALGALLEEYSAARGNRTSLVKVERKLEAYGKNRKEPDRLLALLLAGQALAEAGELEPPKKARDRIDKFRKAIVVVQEVLTSADEFTFDGESCRRRAARLCIELHRTSIRYFESRREVEAAYSDLDLKRDTGYHERGIEVCTKLLED